MAEESKTGRAISGVSSGLGLISDVLAPTPGNSTTDKTTNSTESYNKFIQSLVNALVQSYNTNESNFSGAQTGTSSPNLDPKSLAFRDQLINQYSNLAKPVDMKGYQANGLQDINRNSDMQQTAAQQILASRGLSTSPVSGTAALGIDNQRFGRINEFNNSLPIVANQLNNNNLNAAGSFFSRIPYGTTTTGQQTGVQSGVQTGSQASSTSSTQSDEGNKWGTDYTHQETRVPGRGTASTVSGIAGGIGTMLAGLFSDKRLKEDIKPINKAVEKIMELKPVSYKWKDDKIEQGGLGLLAQDLEKSLPDLVHIDKKSGYRKVDYAGIIPVLVSAVQELSLRGSNK